MILGQASGLPVVAAVAIRDSHQQVIRCPYCNHLHEHGAHGPDAPFGAADGGRLAHCDRLTCKCPQPTGDLMYVIKQVPGSAMWGTSNGFDSFIKRVFYDKRAIAQLRPVIDAFIADYESKWEGVDKPRGGRFHPSEIAFRRGQIPYPAAWKPPVASVPCALYLHYDADDVLLYVGITDSLYVRGVSHARKSTWTQFAVRGEVVWCTDRADAARREVELIGRLRPIFNDAHNGPDRDQRLVAYLASKGRYDLLTPAVSRG